MNDQSCRRIRGANVISALIVIMGCIHVIAFNQESGYIILSGMATMVLWSILCYVTWQGLGTETTPHKIQRAESANRAITLLFFLMFLTILFSSTTTPFPILVPAALLPLPLFVNIRALKFLRVHLKNRDCSPTPDTPKSETSRNDLNIAPHNQTEATRSYVSRHWHGEFRLPIAFWLHGGIITGLGTVTLSSIVHLLNHNVHSLRALSFVNLSALTLLAVVWVWAGVGIWRSAENYHRREGSSCWRNAAQCAVVLSIIIFTAPFSQSFLPQLKECALIASGYDPLGTIHIAVSTNKSSVIVNGMLREGSAEKIKQALSATPQARSLVLNSSGGRVLEAKALAEFVRGRRLDTYVEGQCSSACTFVFLAGINRAASSNAQIGFHQPSFPGIDLPTQTSMTENMLAIYRSAGLPEQFINRISRVSPKDMWYPTRDELIESYVITVIPQEIEETSA